MSLVRRNIASNLAGTITVTVLTFVLTPIQIHILGMEAFGIVGFISTLQAAFTAFDLGLSSTLTRELAADGSPTKAASAGLINTAMTVYWSMAVLLGVGLVLSSPWIGRSWFNPETMRADEIVQSLKVIAIYLALRWPVALYVGILSGFQRMDMLNVVKVASAVLRLAGGILVLAHWRSLQAFLWWTAISAVVEVVTYDIVCRRANPSFRFRFGISRDAVRRVWRFSLSMNLLAILAVILVQLDRLVVSKVLTLDLLGRYNLAYTAASVITLVIGAVSSAVLPALAAVHGANTGSDEMIVQYRAADQAMLFLVGMLSFGLIAYGQQALVIWVGASSAAGTALPMALLAIGFWISSAIANIYNVAIARGAPRRFVMANLIGVVPYAILVYVLTSRYGIVGAATSWIVLNLYYAILLIHPIQRDLIGLRTTAWLKQTVFPCAAIGAVSFGLPRLLAIELSVPETLVTFVAMAAISATAYLLLFGWWIGGVGRLRRTLRKPATP
jgi:O-antigen/teichoic acid export membrane protein